MSNIEELPDKLAGDKEKTKKAVAAHEEIDSDGSASAFDGSELVPEPPQVQKNIKKSTNDPSGNADY